MPLDSSHAPEALVSVIVPVYNVSDWIDRAVKSALSQTYRKIEVILIDDGSTDSSGEICDDYAQRDSRVAVVHQANAGQGAARNAGIRLCRGDYVMFLDADDYLRENAIEVALRAAFESGADVVEFETSAIRSDRDAMRRLRDSLRRPPRLQEVARPRIVEPRARLLLAPSPWNKLYSRNLFTETGVVFPAGVWYEDLRTIPKLLALARNVVAIPESLYYYVHRQGSTMRGNRQTVARNREILDAIDDLANFFLVDDAEFDYSPEIEFLAVQHVLMFATFRVVTLDSRSELLDEFHQYVADRFPSHRNNSYVRSLPPIDRLVLELIYRRAYLPIRFALWMRRQRIRLVG